MEKVDLKKILGDHFYIGNRINENTPYEILDIDARKLIVPSRIDLIAKYKYVEFFDNCINTTFATELYEKHIAAFTNGTYIEPDNPQKNSIDKYKQTFNGLIEKIKENGFDSNISMIPVGTDYGVLDGAHRAACAAYLGKTVRVIRFPEIKFNFDYEYFKDEMLDDIYLDFMVSEYCRIKDNVFVANIWPAADGKEKRQQVNSVIEKYGTVVAKKKIHLTYQGYRNYMLQIYSHHDWVGTFENYFKGVMSKVDACYADDRDLLIYIFECDNLDRVLKLKEEIRNLFEIGNHSIHISDNQIESVQMVELVLNQNSLDLMNNCKPDKYLEFTSLLKKYKDKVTNNKQARIESVIVSDSVLSLYEIRPVNIISWISEMDVDYCENSREYESLIAEIKDEMIFNPHYYCIFSDLKFVTLKVLRDLKIKRDTEQDKKDLELIDERIKQFDKPCVLDNKTKCKRKVKAIKRKVYNVLTSITRKLGVYELIRKMYRKIKK